MTTTDLAETTSALPSPADLPLLAVDDAVGSWGELHSFGEFESLFIAGVVPGSASMLFIEERGRVDEGCEGGIQALGRLSLVDLETGSTTILIPELELEEWRVVLGPAGQLAIMGGCDANAWLAAVGSVDAQGELTFQRLGPDPSDRIAANNNAGVSITWTSDGEFLFFDATRVDAQTGERLAPVDEATALSVHAELADGTRLVSATTGEPADSFWVVDSTVPLNEIPDDAPDFVAQARYPAVQIRIDATGERAYATFENWDDSSVRTVVVGGDALVQLEGTAWPSPSGRRLLVQSAGRLNGEAAAWAMIDLEAGTTTAIPLPTGQVDRWLTVSWGSSDDELLVSARDAQFVVSTPSNIWILDVE